MKKQCAKSYYKLMLLKLNPTQPFTWPCGGSVRFIAIIARLFRFPLSGISSNRRCVMWVFEHFPDAGLLAGVATAGIAWGAMAADQLKLLILYVRPKPKEHWFG
jgi:orotate phosphoribosyltransferase